MISNISKSLIRKVKYLLKSEINGIHGHLPSIDKSPNGFKRGIDSIANKYPDPPKNKEWLYVGYYIDTEGRFILKIGTTNNLARRKAEHTRNYHKSPDFILPKKDSFQYLWWHPLSKYNTIRYEDKNRDQWQAGNIGQYIRNDRFYCSTRPQKVMVKIRKEYEIAIGPA